MATVDCNVTDQTHGQTYFFATVCESVRVRPCFVGRMGLGVRVSASFQQNFLPGSVLRQQKWEENHVIDCKSGGQRGTATDQMDKIQTRKTPICMKRDAGSY